MKKSSLTARLALAPIRVALYAALAFAVLMGVILFAVFRDSIDERTLDGVLRVFRLSGPEGTASQIMIDANPQNQYALYRSRLAVLSPERVVLYDRSGTEAASAVIRMENPRLRAAGDTALVFDRNGAACLIVGEKGVEAAYDDEIIITAELAENGGYALATRRSGYNGVVTVYGAAHHRLFEWHSAESGFVMDIALNRNASMLAVAAVRQENHTVSRLTVLRTNRAEPEAVIDIPDHLIIEVHFMRDTLCVLLEDEARFYKTNGELLETYRLDGRYYLDVRVSDELCVLRTGRQASDYHSVLALLDRSGALIGEIPLEDAAVDAMHAAGSYAGVLQSGTLSLYNAKAELCFSAENLSEVKALRVAPDGSVLLIGQEKAYWVQ
ncbi:MAG: DUF5711 family protein [Oscillospiraceae bacterium]|nr:DUF5711 family protein [Oscillospiraceae bacterium]